MTAVKTLEAALSTGGDFAELFCEDTEGTSIAMINGEVENAAYTRVRGVGIQVLDGPRSAYAYTADTSPDALEATARAAAAALAGSSSGHRIPAFRETTYGDPSAAAFAGVANEARIRLLRGMHTAAKGYSGEITQVHCRYMDRDQRVWVINSDGLWASTRRPYTRISVVAVASDASGSQTGHRGPGFGRGFDVYEGMDVAAFGREAAEAAVTSLHAVECPAGVFPVVIDGGFGGVIFHEACGHSLEATSVSKGNSEFCGKMGLQIAAPCVTAVDDGTLDGAWGSLHGMDDEGRPAQRNVLIENGILKTYLVDRAGGRRMDAVPTGSSRRESYTYAPTSRMTSTFIAPGTDDPDEMIATMGDGLYAKTLGGGSVNPITGEFNFAVDEGYWVKGGRILRPVRGATLIGKGGEVLMAIDRVGPAAWMSQGICGSQSGGVPVDIGQPRIRVSRITVGGKGEAL
ncbi:MAG: TldD/PmbA family protein [Clostridia bacterium]|nr:TldD/PmbA family protein [Clostridia bacterium]